MNVNENESDSSSGTGSEEQAEAAGDVGPSSSLREVEAAYDGALKNVLGFDKGLDSPLGVRAEASWWLPGGPFADVTRQLVEEDRPSAVTVDLTELDALAEVDAEVADVFGELVARFDELGLDWRSREEIVRQMIVYPGLMVADVVGFESYGSPGYSWDGALSTWEPDIVLSFESVAAAERWGVESWRPGEKVPEYGQLVAVPVSVDHATGRLQRYSMITWECDRCGSIEHVPQTLSDDAQKEPHECPACDRQGPFRILNEDSEAREIQHAVGRVRPEDELEIRGDVQPDVEMFAVGSARVDSLQETVGSDAVVLGTVDLRRQSQQSADMVPRLRVLGASVQGARSRVDLSEGEMEMMRRLAASDDLLDRIVDVVGSDLVGLDDELASCVLAATRAPMDETSSVHILMVGDPGTGKSAVAKRVRRISPISEHADGGGSTTAGLTATAVQPDFGSSSVWSIRPGLLPRADGGVLAVDEIDEMDEEVGALLQSMSSGELVATKAGESRRFSADASIIATANPIKGTFNQHESVSEQIGFRTPFVDRFALVWTLTGGAMSKEKSRVMLRREMESAEPSVEVDVDGGAEVLTERVIRGWIAHVQQTVDPMVTRETMDVVMDVVEQLQGGWGEDASSGSIVSSGEGVEGNLDSRMQDSLVALSKARARLHEREDVVTKDVEVAAELLQESLKRRNLLDDGGVVDIEESSEKVSQKRKMEGLLEFVEGEQSASEGVSLLDIIENGKEELGMTHEEARKKIEKLREEGSLREVGNAEFRA